MGWVENVVTLLTGLAWPAVVLTCVLVLKSEIGRLITRLTRLSGAGVEAEFKAQVETAAELALAISPASDDQSPDPPEHALVGGRRTLIDLRYLANANPALGLTAAWDVVISTISLAAERMEIRPHWPPAKVMADLADRQLISHGAVDLYMRLLKLEAQVKRGEVVPDAAEVDDFIGAAWSLAVEISRAHPPSDPT